MTVLPFRPAPPPPELVYVCNCGCRTHFHHADGSVECSACGTFSNVLTGGWAKAAPPPETPPPASAKDDRTVVDMGDPAITIARVLKRASPTETAALIVIQNDSRVVLWSRGDIEGEAAEWMRRRLDDALELMQAPK